VRKPDSVPAFALKNALRRAAAITLCGLPGQKNWSVPAGSNSLSGNFPAYALYLALLLEGFTMPLSLRKSAVGSYPAF